MKHVGDPTFGDTSSITPRIQQLIDTSPKLKFTDAQLLLMDAYETGFGIYNHAQHTDNSRPLALVAMHWAEDNTTQSLLHERIEQFKDRNVYQIFGLSLTEFLDLPRDVCTKILEVCGKRQTQEDRIARDIQSQLKNPIGKP